MPVNNLTVPLTTLQPGTYEFPATGGSPVGSRYNTVDITVDRTVAGGLNSLDASVSLSVTVFRSSDNGQSWDQVASTATQGGVIVNRRTQQPFTVFELVVTYGPAVSDLLRAEVTVTGGAVAVQGSVVFTS